MRDAVIGVEMTGGCQCRRVRYRVEVDDDDASLCHRCMCRATGGFAAALTSVARADVAWEREPGRYRSSPTARRGFCAAEHAGAASVMEAWLGTHTLRRGRTDEVPHLAKRWQEATGHVPE